MATDDERREVAARLRGGYDVVSDAHGRFWLNGTLFGMDITARSEERIRDGLARLADLIEPSGHECVPGECPLNVRHDNDRIDQERLLAIATMMAADSVRSAKQGSSVSPAYILHAARNIAEACGETFGSIRNRELAKWGTSIVPKETIVDRDALLALADEMERRADLPSLTVAGQDLVFSEFLVGYARRVRKACGEGA
jgi:hypothetical protein